MKHSILLVIMSGLLVWGCADRAKEESLQTQLSESQSDRTSLQEKLSERDKYIDDVVRSVNEIYADLELARAKEGKIAQQAKGVEGTNAASSLDTKEQLLNNIDEIGSALKDNRKKIGQLQARISSYRGDIKSLNTLVENLKTSLQEREQSIAQLEAQIQGLEATVAEKTSLLQEKDMLLDSQGRKMNTVYYVAGTRDELRKKGIITEEGGFLWGLLGSTTIMASGVDPAEFTRLDRTKDETIHVSGKIEEILPRRNDEFFAMAAVDDQNSDLKILKPDKFWQDNYLVVVLD
jgi:peptidoglycan hydrolase CwlO-like protein